MDASERGLLLNRFADLIERDSEYIAVSLMPVIFFLINQQHKQADGFVYISS